MTTPISVKTFATRSLDTPDERRTPTKTQIDVVRMEGFTLGRFTLQPGWRWSECIKPVVKTESCQSAHLGVAVSGALVVQITDGTKKTVRAGDSYSIPPGHDAWVEGNQPFVAIEVLSAEQYAKA